MIKHSQLLFNQVRGSSSVKQREHVGSSDLRSRTSLQPALNPSESSMPYHTCPIPSPALLRRLFSRQEPKFPPLAPWPPLLSLCTEQGGPPRKDLDLLGGTTRRAALEAALVGSAGTGAEHNWPRERLQSIPGALQTPTAATTRLGGRNEGCQPKTGVAS